MVTQLAEYVFLGGILVALALGVFAAKPSAFANRALGALLVVTAAEGLVFELARHAPTIPAAAAHYRTGIWFGFAIPWLTTLVFRPPRAERRRHAQWRKRQAGVGVVCGGFAVLFAVAPQWHLAGLSAGALSIFTRVGVAGWAFAGVTLVVQLVVVGWCIKLASDVATTRRDRRQAALIGFAYAGLVAHTAAARVLLLFLSPGRAWSPVLLVAVPCIAAVLFAPFIGRLARAWPGTPGRLLVGSTVAAAAIGVFDAFWFTPAPRAAILAVAPFLDGWYYSSRFAWVTLWAGLLAVAVVRFGLAGLDLKARERATAAALALGGSLLALPAAAVVAASGLGRGALVGTLLIALFGALGSHGKGRGLLAHAGALLVDGSSRLAVERRLAYHTAAANKRTAHTSDEGSSLERLGADLGLGEDTRRALRHQVRDNKPDDVPVLGRYEVQRTLGRGSFGEALLARDVAAGDLVVIKRFRSDVSSRRVLREAEAMAAALHPRLVPLRDVEWVGSEVFLVLEYMPGGTLQERLERDVQLDPDEATDAVLDILDGLVALHAAGLTHLDVKTANVFLDAHGRATLGDFGLVHFGERRDADETRGRDQVGSFGTDAPEILRGHAPTAVCDVYACGAVLYRLLTGRHYVALEDANAYLSRQLVLTQPPRLPHPAVPVTLEAVIERALAKDPTHRYPSAQAMRDALERARLGLDAPAVAGAVDDDGDVATTPGSL